jgi:putative intracellular protease/amidase
MTAPLKILIVLTSHAEMDDPGKPTGFWFEELATPYYVFADAGAEVALASIKGGAAPVDPRSQKAIGDNPVSVDRFLRDADAMAALQTTAPIEAIDAHAYDGIFLPGGHGTMWDLPRSAALAAALAQTFERGGIVSAVCHGPAGLVNVQLSNGAPLVAGKRVSAFTNAEEDAVGLTPVVPFLLETRMREIGAYYESGPDFQPFAVADGNLITGQNPGSSTEVARLVLAQAKANRAGQRAA